MYAFFTVGSTRFDSLVEAALSKPVLSSLYLKNYTRLGVQCGNSNFEFTSAFNHQSDSLSFEREGLVIELWKFKPSLLEEYQQADLVISHAGSGTILDVLRLGKPLIVVPNPTLLDNHQEELASALAGLGHLRSSTVLDLAQTIDTFDPSSLVSFPPFDGSRFARLLDEEMGFI